MWAEITFEFASESAFRNISITPLISVSDGRTFRSCSVPSLSWWAFPLWVPWLPTFQSFQYVVVIYCAVQMQLNMKQRLKNFSATNKALQIQFFRALVVQIILPTLLYSLPAIPLLFVPLLDLKMSVQSGIIIGLFSVYPPLDSLALMLIVSEYKRSIKSQHSTPFKTTIRFQKSSKNSRKTK